MAKRKVRVYSDIEICLAQNEPLQRSDGSLDDMIRKNYRSYLLSDCISLEMQLPVDFNLMEKLLHLCDNKVVALKPWKRLMDEVNSTLKAFN